MQGHSVSCKVKVNTSVRVARAACSPRAPFLSCTATGRKLPCRRIQTSCTADAVSQGNGAAPTKAAEAPETEAAAGAAATDAGNAAARPQKPKPTPPKAGQQRGGPREQEDLSAEWDKMIAHFKNFDLLSGKVVKTNQAGVNVRIGKLLGFIPHKLLDPQRLPEETRVMRATHPEEGYPQLMGQVIKFKVTQINVPERRLICSERAAMLEDLVLRTKQGDVLQGRVTALRDFGAFVEVKREGDETYGAEVLLPLREISWDWIPSTAAALKLGQEVTCVVTNVLAPPKSKVYVSLKRLQEDPLQQTLDKVMPLDGEMEATVPTSVPSGVEDILDELSKEEGVKEVTLGRQAVSAGSVSQDLELWLTKEEVADGFNLVARAGRVVQEIHVVTELTKDDMKQTVQRVLARLV